MIRHEPRGLPMPNTKSERLGLRGTLTLFESAFRLVGGANATGAIASGVAYHAFSANADVQSTIKWAAILFLVGVMTFTVSYVLWLMASIDLDRSLGPEENDLFQTTKSVKEHRKAGKTEFVISIFLALASFACFAFGLLTAIMLTSKL
jgi:hypothetical protein